jgi:adenylate cyclase
MSEGLAQLNRRWEGRLGVPIGLGIGLNSGPALVGNTGSHKKFKYGPLGHTVNLASRVEGATKHLGVQLLITGPTRSFLGNTFAVRRLCRARLVGISGEVELHELCAESAPTEWQFLRDSYETALGLYETGHWREACQALLVQLKESPGIYDLPSISLLGRSVECLKQRPSPFDPVFEFKSK